MHHDPQDDTAVPDFSLGGAFVLEGETDVLLSIETRGEDGEHGRNGVSYHHPPALPGSRGQRGGDATPARPGRHAGSLQLSVEYADPATRSNVRIHGQATRDGRSQLIDSRVTIGDQGYVLVDARGGRGGDGGRAGDGQPGATGERGRDASRHRSGTDGGPGGDGGDAGEPTDGEVGGDGGVVTIAVHHDDTGLVMLFKGQLTGGDLGFAGEPGTGGAGGPGGAGGSSYSWTETEHYRDAQGNQQTRTTFHSNPGGSNGSHGRNGRSSSYKARDGQAGNDGRLRIWVRQADGTQREYPAPFDLELLSFHVASEYRILEPDSLLSIVHLVVRNSGAMPTPANYEIHVTLPSDEWIIADATSMVIPHSLNPGETFEFEEECLRFRLADVVVQGPRCQPFHLRHPVSPLAYLESGIHRPFRDFENDEEIFVQFPVALTNIVIAGCLAPGESTRVRFGVTNVGEETFDDRFGYRSVRANLRLLEGDLDARHLVFFDASDRPFDLLQQEFHAAIKGLAPGETRWVETRIGVPFDAPVIPYQHFIVGVDLLHQRPGSSARRAEYRRVDYRQSIVRISELYRRDATSRFLLIANQRTTASEIEKWTQLADYFGSSLDVWDVSYYGFFDLIRDIDDTEKYDSLLKQWKGMTIIIPNNHFETAAGRTTAFAQLSKPQFLRAANDFDICFYIVGDSAAGEGKLLEQAMMPISDDDAPVDSTTRDQFLKEVRRWGKYVSRVGDVSGDTRAAKAIADTTMGAVHRFPVEARPWLFHPDEKWLEEEARRLQIQLAKNDPLHRWVIVHRYANNERLPGWNILRKRKVGEFEVRRSLDSSKGSAVLYEVPSIDAIAEGFINSSANKHGIFLALKFEDKVDRFIRLVSERAFPRLSENYIDRPMSDVEIEQIGNELCDSILTDLYNEQYVARTCCTWGPTGVAPLLPKLNYLAERSLNYGLTFQQMSDKEATLPLLFRLLASLRYMADRSKTFWDLPILPTAFLKRSRAVSAYMHERVDRIIANLFGPRQSWWDRWNARAQSDPFGRTAKQKLPPGRLRQIAEEHIKEKESELRRLRVAVEAFAQPQSHTGLAYDPELLSSTARVLPGHVYDQLVRNERAADVLRKETELHVAKQRQELIVPMETATQVAVATSVPSASVQTR